MKNEEVKVADLNQKLESLSLETDEQKQEELKQKMILKEMGFSHVVEKMIVTCMEKEIPLIGHNMMYDILYFYEQFIGPLPETYKDFV